MLGEQGEGAERYIIPGWKEVCGRLSGKKKQAEEYSVEYLAHIYMCFYKYVYI